MNMLSNRRAAQVRPRGQALVEFALVIPIFLLVLIGLFDLGRAVLAYTSVTNAAREGARLGIVNQDPNRIKQRAVEQVAIAETADPSVTVAFYDDETLTSTCSTLTVGCSMVSVTFQTTYRPITPIISSFIFPSGVNFTARSILPIEFTCPNATVAAAQCPKQP
jgi:Flp pilus assembly protein TadG